MAHSWVLNLRGTEVGEALSIAETWPRVRTACLLALVIAGGRVNEKGVLQLEVAAVARHREVPHRKQTGQLWRQQALLSSFKCH